MLSFNRLLYLFLIQQFKGERSISGLLHLLKGKKSAQTIQDRLFYKVEPFFGAMPWITLEHINSQVRPMIDEGLVYENEKEHFLLTLKGEEKLSRGNIEESLGNSFFLVPFVLDDRAYWIRLRLLVQVVSEFSHKQHYIPVVSDLSVQQDIKKVISAAGLNKAQLSRELWEELNLCLGGIPSLHAEMIVMQFSGKGIWGRTLQQSAEYLGLSLEQGSLIQKSAIRGVLSLLVNDPESVSHSI